MIAVIGFVPYKYAVEVFRKPAAAPKNLLAIHL